MKVAVDRDICIGCGSCVSICPDVFQLDDEGFSSVIAQPDANNESSAREAADNCPVGAISIG